MKSERGVPRVLRARSQGTSGHEVGRFRKSIQEHAATHRLVASTPAFREACLLPCGSSERTCGLVLAHHLSTTCRA